MKIKIGESSSGKSKMGYFSFSSRLKTHSLVCKNFWQLKPLQNEEECLFHLKKIDLFILVIFPGFFLNF